MSHKFQVTRHEAGSRITASFAVAKDRCETHDFCDMMCDTSAAGTVRCTHGFLRVAGLMSVFCSVTARTPVSTWTSQGAKHMDQLTQSIEGFCPACNRMAVLQVRGEAHGNAPPQLFDQLDVGEDGLRGATYRTAFCPKCETVFLHVSAESEPSEFRYEVMLYPSSDRRSIPGLPETAPCVRERLLLLRDRQLRAMCYHVSQMP